MAVLASTSRLSQDLSAEVARPSPPHPATKDTTIVFKLSKKQPHTLMKYQDPFVCMVIRRIVPLFLAICWMMLALPAASQTQNLPPPKNPDTGPQTNSDDAAGPSMRDRTKGQEDNPVETLKVNV